MLPFIHFRTLLAFLFLFPSIASFSLSAEKSTHVYFDNNELNYVGQISEGGNKELFELFANLPEKPGTLLIRNKGGETDSGVALGTWVHKHGLTVKVLNTASHRAQIMSSQ